MWDLRSSVLLPSITACLLSNNSGQFSAFVVKNQMSNKDMTIEDEPDKLSLHPGQNTVRTQCFRPSSQLHCFGSRKTRRNAAYSAETLQCLSVKLPAFHS